MAILPFLIMSPEQAARFREETAEDENRLDPRLIEGGEHAGKYALPRRVLVIPVLWSVVATVAAFQLGMVEDFSLPLAAIVATAVALRSERRVERLRPA